jgi:hypothetical protein
MATQVQFRRGTTTQNNAFTGAAGELTYDTEIKTLRIHDGTTQGGGATVVTLASAQTLTNKTIGQGSTWSGNAIALAGGGTGASLTAVAGGILYSGGSTLGISAAGNSGQLLISGGSGAPSWISASSITAGTATTATSAANITGGSAGQLIIQSDTSLTTFITAGAAGTFLQSAGAGYAPAWATGGVTIGSTAVNLGATATTLAGLTSVTSTTFVGALTGNASTATTLATNRAINGVNFNGSAAITITANTTNALTIGTGLSGTSFNGSAAVTIAIDSTVVTLTGTQTLTNKTLTLPTIGGTGAAFSGSTSGTTTVLATATAGTTTLTLPAATDTLVGKATTDTLTNKTINLANNTLTTTSAQLATALTDETGTGVVVFSNNPTLVGPTLGTALATSINRVTITAPSTGSTLTIADLKTFTVSNTLTLTGTDASSVAFGAGGTVVYTANKLSVHAATTSAELAGVISDETGTGALVFGTSPAITTSLTTPSTSFDLINTTATTVNFAGAGTAVTIGATTGTTTVRNSLVVTGDLTINGTTTTINATTITVDDKNIELGSVASPTDVTADGGGITLKGATDKSITWSSIGWTSSEDFNLVTGKTFEINGTSVLSATTLGSGVTGSSLTSVGTITSGTWSGSFGAVSGANLTSLNASNISSGTLPAARMPALTGDITTTAGAVATTLATVNSNVGSFGSTSAIPIITVNAKGLITAVSTAAVTAAVTAAGGLQQFTDSIYQFAAFTYTTTTASAEVIYTIPIATYRSAELTIQMANNAANYRIMKVLLVHNGTTVTASENYVTGTEVQTAGTNTTMSYDISGGNIRVLATVSTATTVFKGTAMLYKV